MIYKTFAKLKKVTYTQRCHLIKNYKFLSSGGVKLRVMAHILVGTSIDYVTARTRCLSLLSKTTVVVIDDNSEPKIKV